MFGFSIFTYLKIGAMLVIGIFVVSVVNNYTAMSGIIAENEQTIKRLEGKLTGAYMRIDRRDNAIAALPDKCRAQAQEWVKTGDIPAPFNPFGYGESSQR